MLRIMACAMLVCLAAAGSLRSQNSLGAPQDTLVRDDHGYVLSVDVDLVSVIATVTDESGRYVEDLGSGDFRVLENGQEQKIAFFSHDAHVPISLGVLIDSSGSLQDKLHQSLQTVRAIAASLSSTDEMFVMTFNSHAGVKQRFTSNSDDLEHSLRDIRGHGETAVFDAVAAGLREMQAAKNRKRILVLVTDGFDNASKITPAEAENLVERSGVVLYTIGIDDPDDHPPHGRPKYHIYEYMLGRLSRAGGGRLIKLYTGAAYDLRSLAQSILGEFHQEYTMGYYPGPGGGSAETWRSIEVRVDRPGIRILSERLNVQHR